VTYAWNHTDRDSAFNALWCAAPVVAQSKLGLCPERHRRPDPCHCCDSAASRQNLNCAHQHAKWAAAKRRLPVFFPRVSASAWWDLYIRRINTPVDHTVTYSNKCAQTNWSCLTSISIVAKRPKRINTPWMTELMPSCWPAHRAGISTSQRTAESVQRT